MARRRVAGKTSLSGRPIARIDGLLACELGGETIIYDQDRDHAHCLNPTAALVFRHCNGKNSAADIARRMTVELKTPVEDPLVWDALERLSRSNLLLEQINVPPSVRNGMTRREFVRNLGLASLVAMPAISSIVAPTPAHAQSVNLCNSNSDCPDGLKCKQIPGLQKGKSCQP